MSQVRIGDIDGLRLWLGADKADGLLRQVAAEVDACIRTWAAECHMSASEWSEHYLPLAKVTLHSDNHAEVEIEVLRRGAGPKN